MHLRVRDDHADDEQGERADLHEGGQVIARGDEQPVRQRGGGERVEHERHHELLGVECEDRREHRVRSDHAAADDREHEQHEAENRRFDHTARAQEPLIAPHDQGDWDRHAEREHRPRRRRHRLDCDEREERHRDGGDDDKEHGDDEAADLAHLVGGHLTE